MNYDSGARHGKHKLGSCFVQAVKFSTGEQERDTKLHRRGIRFLKRVVTIEGIERFGERA